MLEVADLHAYYGRATSCRRDVHVGEGEIVSLLGRNGAGRSTGGEDDMGLVRRRPHQFRGERIDGLPPHRDRALGAWGYVPEDREIFPSLTVRENLRLGMKRAQPRAAGPRRRLRAVSRAARARRRARRRSVRRRAADADDLPDADGRPGADHGRRADGGLAPQMVERCARLLEQIAARGVAILLIEQKLTIALCISRRLYVMGQGRIVFEGSAPICATMRAFARNGSKSDRRTIIGAAYDTRRPRGRRHARQSARQRLGYDTRSDVVAGIDRANADAACDAIVVTGGGKAFSGGADIREFIRRRRAPSPRFAR
jgi:branched-chain amino acid transport system ATP-binding protein